MFGLLMFARHALSSSDFAHPDFNHHDRSKIVSDHLDFDRLEFPSGLPVSGIGRLGFRTNHLEFPFGHPVLGSGLPVPGTDLVFKPGHPVPDLNRLNLVSDFPLVFDMLLNKPDGTVEGLDTVAAPDMAVCSYIYCNITDNLIVYFYHIYCHNYNFP